MSPEVLKIYLLFSFSFQIKVPYESAAVRISLVHDTSYGHVIPFVYFPFVELAS